MKRYIIFGVICALAAMTLTAQRKAKAPEAAQLLADGQEALMLYDTEALDNVIDTWEAALKRTKKPAPAELTTLKQRALTMRNMLERVEQITIVDSFAVDTAQFFKHYRLAADAGRIDGTASMTSFTPPSANERFFTVADTAGRLSIMHAGVLDDGSDDIAEVVDLQMAPSSNTAYPFMLTDGTTFYFANDAGDADALGGYDIYMTRRDAATGQFLQPVNMGMPYNSPANDYMLALDDVTGLGWWATDRNAEDGTLTIYVFERGDGTRRNYDPGNPDIANLAFISSVAATQPEGYDARQRLDDLSTQLSAPQRHAVDGGAFSLSLGNGRVLRSLNQFASPEARRMMAQWLNDAQALKSAEAKIARMRTAYAEGNVTLGTDIARAEQALATARTALLNSRNAIIRTENQAAIH